LVEAMKIHHRRPWTVMIRRNAAEVTAERIG
jgi:hypothetical protein